MLTILTNPRHVQPFAVYDAEWIPGTLQVRIVGYYDGNSYRAFPSFSAFLDAILIHSNRGVWFYAHAGGMADVQFVLEECIKKGYTVRAHFSGSSAIIVTVSKQGHSWTFVDSFFLLRDKLANIAKAIGMEKGSETYREEADNQLSDEEADKRDKERKEWYATVDLLELRRYNENDCIILYKAIEEFQISLLQLGGELRYTLASCSLALFRRKYLSENLSIWPEVNELARMTYFASRVEVFVSEVWDAMYYDVNSSFPYAMTFEAPGEPLSRLSRKPDSGIYLAKATVRVPQSYLPPLPLRLEGRVFFPSGEWEGYFMNTDLDLLEREGGQIIRCHEAISFAPFDDLKAFATDLYAKRMSETSAMGRLVYKLLLNSLYGKFAEIPTKQSLLINPKSTANLTDMLMPGVYLKEDQIDIPHMHVALSSHITSIARRTLYDYMSLCKDVHYCDTDGFSTTEVIPDGKGLGQLKLEKRVIHGQYVLPKLYSIEGETEKGGEWKKSRYVRGKGFSRLTYSRFSKLLEGESIGFERMARIRQNMRDGNITPREMEVSKRVRLGKVYSPNFDPTKQVVPKRFHYPDGETRPWDISELQGMFRRK